MNARKMWIHATSMPLATILMVAMAVNVLMDSLAMDSIAQVLSYLHNLHDIIMLLCRY